MPQSALAQQVEFVQTKILRFQHAELRDGKTLRWPVQRGVAGNGRLADQHAARVDTELVWHAKQVVPIADHHLRDPVQVAARSLGQASVVAVMLAHARSQRVDLRRRKAQRLAQLPDGTAPLEGGVGGKLCHMVMPALPLAKTGEHVLVHFVAVLPTEVDVEVRRLFARCAEEALEVEVQLDRVHVGDAEAVGDHAVRAATPAHMEKALAAGEAHDVLVDEEVADEAHALDHVQLVLHARDHLL